MLWQKSDVYIFLRFCCWLSFKLFLLFFIYINTSLVKTWHPTGWMHLVLGFPFLYCNVWCYHCPLDLTNYIFSPSKIKLFRSVSDPLQFNADPDTRIRFRDNGSGSSSGSDSGPKMEKIPILFFIIFFCKRNKTHNDVFFL